MDDPILQGIMHAHGAAMMICMALGTIFGFGPEYAQAIVIVSLTGGVGVAWWLHWNRSE